MTPNWGSYWRASCTAGKYKKWERLPPSPASADFLKAVYVLGYSTESCINNVSSSSTMYLDKDNTFATRNMGPEAQTSLSAAASPLIGTYPLLSLLSFFKEEELPANGIYVKI